MAEAAMRHESPCIKCGSEVIRDRKGHRRCPACRAASRPAVRTKEYRQGERRRAAERAGKGYTPGVVFWTVSPKHGPRLPHQISETTWRRIEVRNALEAWRWWLEHAPAEWTARRAPALARSVVITDRLKDFRRRAADGAGDGHWDLRAAAERELARKRCPYCDRGMTAADVHLDHMDPLGRGGEHSALNLIGCCAPCNRRKGALPFADWLRRLAEPHRSRALTIYRRRFAARDSVAA